MEEVHFFSVVDFGQPPAIICCKSGPYFLGTASGGSHSIFHYRWLIEKMYSMFHEKSSSCTYRRDHWKRLHNSICHVILSIVAVFCKLGALRFGLASGLIFESLVVLYLISIYIGHFSQLDLVFTEISGEVHRWFWFYRDVAVYAGRPCCVVVLSNWSVYLVDNCGYCSEKLERIQTVRCKELLIH